MIPGIIGKKLGMSQIFREDGRMEAVTAVEAGPCCVVQVKAEVSEGYGAVQLGFGEAKRLKSPERGHLKGLGKFQHLREFRVDDVGDVQVGDKVDASLFEVGEKVDVTGISSSRLHRSDHHARPRAQRYPHGGTDGR